MEKEKNSARWFLLWVSLGAFFWLLAGCVVAGLAGCMYVSGAATGEQEARVTFLDVGQGLSVLLEYDGKYALYDAGPDSVGVMDTLASRGVDTLQWAVISHYHRDHGGGLLELVKAGVVVKRLYVGTDTAGGFVRDSLMRMAEKNRWAIDTLRRGDEIALQGAGDDRLSLKVLWPPEYVPVGENSASLVLSARLENSGGKDLGGGSLLLTGDLDSVGERRLLELSPTLETDLLQVPHHGSAGSSTLKFLSQVSPRYAAISVGKDNGYGHPAPSVLKKLAAVLGDTSAIFRTDRDGSVTFRLIPAVGAVP